MNQRTTQILFSILRSGICGEALSEDEKSAYSEEILPEMFSVAKKHDITQILAAGLEQNELPGIEHMEMEQIKAVYRHEQLKYALEQLCDALEAAKIPFMPLKGSVIRQYYRIPWMRTSCDIDILVHEEDLDKAVAYLIQNCDYTVKEKGSHDISLFTPSKNHVELHYNLVEDGLAKASSSVLKSVWSVSCLYHSKLYWHEMPDEMFYFYHIAHMAKHFENGGCGIRPFIDLWILDALDGIDVEKRNVLLKRGGLFRFAECARELNRVWFADAEHTAMSMQMEHYILSGGVYGTTENRIVVQQQKQGGKFKYALSKIFIPYEVIKFHYPVLQKHRWLTPVMEIRRWFKLVFCGHAKRSLHELKYNNAISADQAAQTKSFLDNIGL